MADMTPAGRAARQLDAIAAELDRMVLLRRYAPPPAHLRKLAEQIRQATAIVNEARLTAEGQPLPAPIVIEHSLPECVFPHPSATSPGDPQQRRSMTASQPQPVSQPGRH